jgi:TP901 family phage tail tape measure protein
MAKKDANISIRVNATAVNAGLSSVAVHLKHLESSALKAGVAMNTMGNQATAAGKKTSGSYAKALNDSKRLQRSIDPITGSYQKLGEQGKMSLTSINDGMIKLLRGRAGLVVLGLIAKQAFDVLIGNMMRSSKEAAKLTGKVETLALQIETLTLGTDQERLFPPSMEQDILSLAVAFGETFEAIGKARYDVVSAGFIKTAESVQVLDSSLRLAIAGVTDSATATKLLVGAMKAYGAEADEAARFSDVLFATVQKGITTIPELAGSFGRVAAIASIAKVPIEEVGAALAVMTQKGLKTSEATTALRALLKALLDTSSTAGQELKAMGIDLESGLGGALISISQASGDSAEALKAMFGNTRSFTAAASIGTDGARQYYEALRHIEGASDVAAKAQELLADSAERQTARIEAAEKRLQAIGGRGYAKQMTQSADEVIESLNSMSGVIDATGQHSGAVLAKLELEWKEFSAEVKPLASVLAATFGTLALAVVLLLDTILYPMNKLIQGFSWLGEKVGLIDPLIESMGTETKESAAAMELLNAKLAEILLPLEDVAEATGEMVSRLSRSDVLAIKIQKITDAFNDGKISAELYVSQIERINDELDNTPYDRIKSRVDSLRGSMSNLTSSMDAARLKQWNKESKEYLDLISEDEEDVADLLIDPEESLGEMASWEQLKTYIKSVRRSLEKPIAVDDSEYTEALNNMTRDEYLDYWSYQEEKIDNVNKALSSLFSNAGSFKGVDYSWDLPDVAPEDELLDAGMEGLQAMTAEQVKQHELWLANKEKAKDFSDELRKTAEQVSENFSSRISGSLMDIMSGSKKAGDAFKEMAMGMIADMTQMTIKLLTFNLLMSSLGVPVSSPEIGGMAKGGDIPKAAAGMMIPNTGQAGLDSVPFIGMPGEGVIKRNTMQRLERFLSSSESSSAMGIQPIGGGSPMMVNFNIARPQSASDSVGMARTVSRMAREYNRRVM